MAKPKRKLASGDVASNRQAAFRYDLLDKLECGIVLTGTEVKSLREGGGQLREAYAQIREGELWLIGAHIAPYAPAARAKTRPQLMCRPAHGARPPGSPATRTGSAPRSA